MPSAGSANGCATFPAAVSAIIMAGYSLAMCVNISHRVIGVALVIFGRVTRWGVGVKWMGEGAGWELGGDAMSVMGDGF